VIYLGVESVSRVQFSSERVQFSSESSESSEFGELQSLVVVGIRGVAGRLRGVVFGEEVINGKGCQKNVVVKQAEEPLPALCRVLLNCCERLYIVIRCNCNCTL
jgi:hypothetical protein